MPKPPYLGRALLSLFILLPLLLQVFAIVALLATSLVAAVLNSNSSDGMFIAVGTPFAAGFLFLCFRAGRNLIRKQFALDEPTEAKTGFLDKALFVTRYLPVLLAFAYTLTISLLALLQPVPSDGAIFGPASGVIFIAHFFSALVAGMIQVFGVPSIWPVVIPPLCIYAAYGFGLGQGFRELRAPRTASSALIGTALLIALAVGAMIWRADFMMRGILRGGSEAWYAERTFTDRYHPFQADNELVKVAKPTLTISSDAPRLDGATAAYPIYAAAVQAIYPNLANETRKLVRHSTTPEAYDRLIKGETDLIFVAQPSNAQRAAAEAAGHPLQLTPIAREAFVFFVHQDNPVDGLTSDQIRAIYTKKITNWKAVGGRDEKILPFQRPEGSGSQTALELKVMRGEPLPTPPREEFARGMGGVIQQVASYQNSREAIGYSFRTFATTMNLEDNIKLLRIDGVPPDRESIRADAYPYTVDVYAATAGTTNPHVPELIAWFLSPQGQQLIDETGYVSIPHNQ